MQDQSGLHRWLPAVFGVFLATIVGFWAYNVGVAHGIAIQLPAGAAGAPPWAYYRPWGFGPFFPLFFLVFWFVVVRAFLFRGGPWRRGWGGYYDGRSFGVPPAFEEWHRRAHEREAKREAPPR